MKMKRFENENEEKAAVTLSMSTACRKGLHQAVKLLLEGGGDPNETEADDEADDEDEGCSLLHVAGENGHAAVVKVLLEAGADKDRANGRGHTPLISASKNGHVEVVSVLLSAGADKDKLTHGGCAPLHFVCQNGHAGVAVGSRGRQRHSNQRRWLCSSFRS